MGEQFKSPRQSYDTNLFNEYFTQVQVEQGVPKYFRKFDEDNQVRALYDIFMFVIAYFEKLKIDWIKEYDKKQIFAAFIISW